MTEAELLLLIKTKADTAGMDEVASKAGGLSEKLGGIGKGMAIGGAAVAGAAAGIGTALLGVGMQFDDAFDGMAVKTGATGKDLEALQGSFKNVIGNTPADFDTVSAAMGTMSQRTGATGKDLEALTLQVADLSRITGVDATAAATAAADVFGKFGTKASDQTFVMDQLFMASQNSGVAFDTLAGQVAQFAPQLDAMGMGAGTGAGFLGQMAKAGIDAGAVMPGLTKAIGAMVKDGIDPMEGLGSVFEKIKSEGSNSATAMETFGKSGLQMAAAISSGAMDVGDLADVMSDAGGRIKDTATGTADFGEKLSLFKNKLMVAMEPAGTALMDGITAAFTKLEPYLPMIADGITRVFSFFTENPMVAAVAGIIGAIGTALGAVMVVIGPLIAPIMAVVASFGGMAAIGTTLMGVIGTVAAVLTGPFALAIGAVVLGIALWKAKGEEIVAWISEWGGKIIDKFKEIFGIASPSQVFLDFGIALIDGLIGGITGMIGSVLTILVEFGASIFARLDTAWNAVWAMIVVVGQAIWQSISDKWTEIKDTITERIEAARVMISAKWDAIKEYLDAKLTMIKAAVSVIFDAISTKISEAMQAVQDKIDAAWDWINDKIHDALNSIQDIFNNVMDWISDKTGVSMDAIKGYFDDAMTVVHDLVDAFISWFKGDWDGMWESIKRAGDNAWTAIKNVFNDGWEALKRILNIDALLETFKSGMSRLETIGSDLIEGLKRGISKGWDTLSSWMTGLFGDLITLAKKILGIASPSRVMADEIGEPMAMGIVEGIRAALRMNPLGELVAEWGKKQGPGFIAQLISPVIGAAIGAAITAGIVAAGGTPEQVNSGRGWSAWNNTQGGSRVGIQQGSMGKDSADGRVKADAFRSGKGGLLAASSSNYWQVFVSKWGVPTESSARKVARQLGIPLPQWLEDIYNPPGGSTVDRPDVLKDPEQAAEVTASLRAMGDAAINVTDALNKLGGVFRLELDKGVGGQVGVGGLPGGGQVGGPIVIEPPPGGAVSVQSVSLGNIVMGAINVNLDGKAISRAVASAFIEDVTILDQLGKALGKRKAVTS